MFEDLCKWKKPILQRDGVIVGCSKQIEWLLPWWWMHFRLHNEYPVTFFEFDEMTPMGRAWCCKRGLLLPLQIPTNEFVVNKDRVSPESAAIWEKSVSGIDAWKGRLSWFKKPFACLQSPYERTIWIDLDCQVRKSIDKLFLYCENPFQFSLAEEPSEILRNHEEGKLILPGEMEYNTGVMVFKNGSELVSDWARMCIERNNIVRGDQEAISRLLHEKGIKLIAMPPEFNRRYHLPQSPNTIIIHWLGVGKSWISHQMKLLQDGIFMDLSISD